MNRLSLRGEANVDSALDAVVPAPERGDAADGNREMNQSQIHDDP